jgi:molybdopterin-guanine dinucleotide biosynthesis protein A
MPLSPPEPETGFDAVLLAGGRSVRMGRDKALLPHPGSGHPLVLHQLKTLRAAGATEVFLSVRAGTDYPSVPADVRRLHDDGTRGPIAGIAAALAVCTRPRLLVLAVDLPGVTPALLRDWLARSPTEHGFVPLGRGVTEPLCALYPRTALPFFETALNAERFALRGVVEELRATGLMHPIGLKPVEATALANWNSPADMSGGESA